MGRAFRLLFWPAAASLAALAVLLTLGTWQMERLAWKEALIARVSARLAQPPVSLPPETVWPALQVEGTDYLPVEVTGRFLHDKEVHVFHALTRPKGPVGGQGWFVLTPLVRADGSVVIVNRGFVPDARKDPATRAAGQVEGEVTLRGLLRRPEESNSFTPADDPARRIWFTRDARRIAAAVGLPAERTFPFTLDRAADPPMPGGLPQGGETLVTFTNNHLQYAVTWYGIALTLIGVFVAFARARLRGADPAPPR